MSETTEITRRPRSERPTRQVHRDDAETPPNVVIESGDPTQGGPSPSQALDDVTRQLTTSTAQLNEERRRRQAAEQAAVQAQRGRHDDHRATLASTIEAAKAEIAASKAARRAAREAGDFDAEDEALEAGNRASFRLHSAEAELAALPKEGTSAAPNGGQPQPQPQMSPEAAKWIAEHPRMHTDAEYNAYAISMHHAALQAGQPVGSQQYVDWIEQRMAARFGDNHGAIDPLQRGGTRRETMDRDTPRGGESVPSNRGGGGNHSGWKRATTPKGDLLYLDQPDGTRRIRYSDEANQKADLEEFASITFPKLWAKDPRAALGEYLTGLVECAVDGSPDLRIGDGRRVGTSDDD